MAEGETAELTMTASCIYRAGQALSCPGKILATVQGRVMEVPNVIIEKAVSKAINPRSGQISQGVLNTVANQAINQLPGMRAINCAETIGDGVCDLVLRRHNIQSSSVVVNNTGKVNKLKRKIIRLNKRSSAVRKKSGLPSSKLSRRPIKFIARIRVNANADIYNRPSATSSPTPTPTASPTAYPYVK